MYTSPYNASRGLGLSAYTNPRPDPNQVYYDTNQGKYYTLYQDPFFSKTTEERLRGLIDQGVDKGTALQMVNRNYLNGSPFARQSQITNRQPYQYNAPTAAQMFGGMQAPTQFSGMFGGMPGPNMGVMTPTMGMQGQYGAGRFLGGNTGLLGGNSTSMLGT